MEESNILAIQRTGDLCNMQPFLDAIDLNNAVMAEIGVYIGESTEQFMASGKFQRLYAIDSFIDYDDYYKRIDWAVVRNTMKEAEEMFDLLIQKYPITKIKKVSVDAVNLFPDHFFDLVYIDANHNYEYVRQDIELWLPKVKLGGYITGHDYQNIPDVKRAVDEILGDVQIFIDCSWLKKIS